MRRSRVLVAAAGLLFCLMALWLRVAWIQVGQHGYYAERADRLREQRVLLKPVRGNLLDRRGRMLARDLVTYSISAAPREMRRPSRTARELAAILKLDPRRLQREFAAKHRFLWVARRVSPEIGAQISKRNERGVYVAPETQRVYALGAAAAEVLGRTDLDNSGVDGLELQWDEALRGRPGWATLFRDGRGRSHAMPGGLRRPPEDGQHVVLTLDADLQAIVETHLAAAVDSLNALRGFALFMEPRTGEILAAVSVPHLEPGKARNWNFTDTYEPGSTYKIVAAGAALEEGVARPNQVFEAAESGVAQVAPGALFHDVHKEARYTFRDAVRWSSNIVIGKIGALLGAERLYRYSTTLGFGSLTGVDFPGEAAGKLRSPDRWSLRSPPTIAIGHELAVTPLQLTLAYAAVANGGVLMRPMLVREIRDLDGHVVRRFQPQASHRVFSEHTSGLLREMLTAVVDSGTARAARVDGLPVAGKTGTSQKYDAAVKTYGKGLYLSSFAGFAPAGAPQLVGVVVIDEPRGRRYYGGEVAAPVFRQVIGDLRFLPDGPLDSGASRVAVRPPAPAPVTVPDLRLLPPRAAEHALAERRLAARFEGDGPRVLAQDPPPGTAVERGARVRAWLAAPQDSAGSTLPSLIGMSVRDALRHLSLRGVAPKIVGHGLVVRQEPDPGARLPLRSRCVLHCQPGLTIAALGPFVGPEAPRSVIASQRP
ncbi:MAG TPA: penicillin-binding transpeptidase domain-containing protein [Candidatus Limnocylindria bacterium]|nr:penicillin-binding transpeptidase domain-containing protein [Candidatus Limnocylindria bacterium]